MNQLQNIEEFRSILADYHLSPAALLTVSQVKLILLTAPTSTGRNTVINEVLKTGDYYFIVSDTTRKPRINDGVLEQDGREYWFRKEADMLADIRSGEFLEAAVIHNQQVSGISIRELRKAQELEKIAITDAEIAGAANINAVKSDAVSIFMLPPSFEEWQRRIKHRGDMEAGEYRRRMQSAAIEFKAALDHDYYHLVINDSVAIAAERINRIAKLDEYDKEDQAEARNLAERLYLETQALISSLDA